MIERETSKASNGLTGISQNASDTVVAGTQIASDLAVGTSEYVSMKTENVIHEFEDATADWVNENTQFAGEQLVEMASTASLFGNLARSASEPVADEKGNERLEKFGDPSAKVKEPEEEEEYVPRKLRKYM